jgi:hypothetical protein
MSLPRNYDFYVYSQCEFDKTISDRMFGSLSDHMYDKWVSDRNIINFIARMDQKNQQRFFSVMGSLYDDQKYSRPSLPGKV